MRAGSFFFGPTMSLAAALALLLACSPWTFSTWCRSCSTVSGCSCATAPSTPSTAPRSSTSTVRVGRGAPRLSSLGSLALASARSPMRPSSWTEARATSISGGTKNCANCVTKLKWYEGERGKQWAQGEPASVGGRSQENEKDGGG